VLNPLIYSLRNKDVKDAAKKALRSKIQSPWPKTLQDSSHSSYRYLCENTSNRNINIQLIQPFKHLSNNIVKCIS
jgi:hypothetical protein